MTAAAATGGARFSRTREGATVLGIYLASIAVALVVAAVVLYATGGSWSTVFSALLDGSVRRPGRWGTTIGEATPLLLVALGTIINSRAGLVNIGQEGQLYVGAALATYVATHIGLSGPFMLILLLLAGIVGGAIWAGIASVLYATGGSWSTVLSALLDGSVRRPGRWGTTIGEATPLLLVALGTIINSRAGLVNIGQEGQLYVGAALATYVATHIGLSGPLVVILLLLAGIVGGAIWAGIASVLRYQRRIPEVLSTLLLVFVAAQAVGYGLKNTSLLLDPTPETGNRNLISEQLDAATRIPRVSWFGNEFPISAFVALILAVLVALALTWTVAGFRLQMLGQGLRTAHRAGVSESRYGGLALVVSGAFCGLAGAFMFAGGDFGNYRLTPGFAVNIGWEGLLVALVARTHPILAIPAAFVFAALRTGSGFLAATGVDRDITKVVQALLVLALLVPPAVLFVRDRRRALAAARDRV